MPNKLSMPISSWIALKQIVRAYGEVQEVEKPTGEDVARIAGLPRTVVSANNKFLREIGIVLPEENKPTELGSRLAAALAMNNDALVSEALQEIVRADTALSRFVGMVRARAPVKVDLIKSEIAIAAGLKHAGPTKPIIDLLQESKLIRIDDDVIRIAGETPVRKPDAPPVSPNEPMKPESPASPNGPMGQGQMARGIPLPLGPTRLAYIQLPENWESKELPKLLKLLQIALGDDTEGN
jgi:hypothetical protein